MNLVKMGNTGMFPYKRKNSRWYSKCRKENKNRIWADSFWSGIGYWYREDRKGYEIP